MGKTLHPSIVEFKAFVKKYPKMMQEVRSGNKTLQEFYEEWSIIGEKDAYWKAYENPNEAADSETIEGEVVSGANEGRKKNLLSFSDVKAPMEWLGTAFGYLKEVDMNQLQNQITNVGTTIASIQSVIDQFRKPAGSARKETGTPKKQAPPTFKQED